jgi:WD40 repeat protein
MANEAGSIVVAGGPRPAPAVRTPASKAKLRVFFCYSRRDSSFADRLVAALEARGFDVLIDRRDLPKLEDWERELLDFIRRADTIVFIVSPHSATSPICKWEVEQVRVHAKRLAPVVIADIADISLPDEIAKINYLFFTDETLFDARADELAFALNTDVAWLKEHTRLHEMARRWDGRGRLDDGLIGGRELDDADVWAAQRPREAPVVTSLHQAFLAASRTNETDRIGRERAQNARTIRIQRRLMLSIAGILGIVSATLAAAAWQVRSANVREANVLIAKSLDAEREGQPRLALLYALSSLPAPHHIPFLNPVLPQANAAVVRAANRNTELAVLKGHEKRIVDALLTADGKRMVTFEYYGRPYLWNLETMELIRPLEGKHTLRNDGKISSDGKLVATVNFDKIFVWRTLDGALLHTLTGHHSSVYSVDFDASGSLLASSAGDGFVMLWSTISGIRKGEYAVSSPIDATGSRNIVAFSPAGDQLIVASSAAQIDVSRVDLVNDKVDKLFSYHDILLDDVKFIAAAPSVSILGNKMISLWSINHNALEYQLPVDVPALTDRCHHYSQDGRLLVMANRRSTEPNPKRPEALLPVRLWDVSAGKVVKEFENPDDITCASLSPDGSILATVSERGITSLRDAETGRDVKTLGNGKQPLWQLAFSADGKRLVTTGEGFASVFDSNVEPRVFRMTGRHFVTSAFALDSDRLVIRDRDRRLGLFLLADGGEFQWHDPPPGVVGVCGKVTSPYWVLSHEDEVYVKFRMSEKQLRIGRKGNNERFFGCFSEGRFIVMQSSENGVRLIELSTGETNATVGGEQTFLLSSSNDGKYCVFLSK